MANKSESADAHAPEEKSWEEIRKEIHEWHAEITREYNKLHEEVEKMRKRHATLSTPEAIEKIDSAVIPKEEQSSDADLEK